MTAVLRVVPHGTRHRLSPYVHGQFIESLGTSIRDGIWVGPRSDIPNADGIRLDTADALRRLGVPVVRWPGGLWADSYHWQDGIGPRDRRPVRQNLGWRTLEDNQFGTHEFMRFCRMIGAEPYLCCNLGSGTVEEARSWAEYCNCAGDTTLARMRAAHGDPRPFDVKFWGLGNESAYVLDGMMTPEHYANLARQYAGYVKLHAAQCHMAHEGPLWNYKTVLALNLNWIEPFVKAVGNQAAWNYFDLLSVHLFSGRYHPDPVEEYRMYLADLGKMEDQLNVYREWAIKLSTEGHSVDIAADEWASWRKEAGESPALVQPVKMIDGIFSAGLLHILHDNEKVYLASPAQACNVLFASIRTDGHGFYLTPIYHVFDLMKPHRARRLVTADAVGAPVLSLPENRSRGALSSCVTVSDDGRDLYVTLINFDSAAPLPVRLDVAGGRAWRVTETRQLAESALDAENTFPQPERIRVKTLETALDGGRPDIELPPHSLTSLRICMEDL